MLKLIVILLSLYALYCVLPPLIDTIIYSIGGVESNAKHADESLHRYIKYMNLDNGCFVGDGRFPNYRNIHHVFIDPTNGGCGSCIYNKLDPNSDGVLPDWQRKLMAHGMNNGYASPPLDNDKYAC